LKTENRLREEKTLKNIYFLKGIDAYLMASVVHEYKSFQGNSSQQQRLRRGCRRGLTCCDFRTPLRVSYPCPASLSSQAQPGSSAGLRGSEQSQAFCTLLPRVLPRAAFFLLYRPWVATCCAGRR